MVRPGQKGRKVVVTQQLLPLTGERTVPGIVRENYWFRRHEVVYRWITANGYADGTVIEAGCGEGYGADILRTAGAQVVAVDYDDAVIGHVRRTYPRVQTLKANLIELPLRSSTADGLISLQVIEHLWDLPTFWAEIRRVVRPGGRVVISTPNRLTFSPGVARGQKPTNPFHVEEFDAGQLAHMLTDAGFSDVRVLGLRHGPRLLHTDVVARQIDAVLSDSWTQDLLTLVAGVTVTDFVIGEIDPDLDLDLVAVARR
jgi:SAM-dependent methyltransferase